MAGTRAIGEGVGLTGAGCGGEEGGNGAMEGGAGLAGGAPPIAPAFVIIAPGAARPPAGNGGGTADREVEGGKEPPERLALTGTSGDGGGAEARGLPPGPSGIGATLEGIRPPPPTPPPMAPPPPTDEGGEASPAGTKAWPGDGTQAVSASL